jgi:hypothetical protein
MDPLMAASQLYGQLGSTTGSITISRYMRQSYGVYLVTHSGWHKLLPDHLVSSLAATHLCENSILSQWLDVRKTNTRQHARATSKQ